MTHTPLHTGCEKSLHAHTLSISVWEPTCLPTVARPHVIHQHCNLVVAMAARHLCCSSLLSCSSLTAMFESIFSFIFPLPPELCVCVCVFYLGLSSGGALLKLTTGICRVDGRKWSEGARKGLGGRRGERRGELRPLLRCSGERGARDTELWSSSPSSSSRMEGSFFTKPPLLSQSTWGKAGNSLNTEKMWTGWASTPAGFLLLWPLHSSRWKELQGWASGWQAKTRVSVFTTRMLWISLRHSVPTFRILFDSHHIAFLWRFLSPLSFRGNQM